MVATQADLSLGVGPEIARPALRRRLVGLTPVPQCRITQGSNPMINRVSTPVKSFSIAVDHLLRSGIERTDEKSTPQLDRGFA
jgi:hypothetical protein